MSSRATQVRTGKATQVQLGPVREPSRHDRIFSFTHRKFVRFSRWVGGDFAEVADSDSLVTLPDLVHRSQLG